MMRYTQPHSWPAHNCSQPPALRPCPRTQRGPAARSAAALGTPRSPITISLRPMKNCGSSAAARGGLAAGWGNSTQHQQHIVRSSQEEDLVNWLNSLTSDIKFIQFTGIGIIGSHLAPTSFERQEECRWDDKAADSLLTGDGGDLREGELEQHLLLVIHHVHARPVHRDYHIVLGQVGTWTKFMDVWRISFRSVLRSRLQCTSCKYTSPLQNHISWWKPVRKEKIQQRYRRLNGFN